MREDEAGDAVISKICLALIIGWVAGACMMDSSLSKQAKERGVVLLDGVIYRLTEVGK